MAKTLLIDVRTPSHVISVGKVLELLDLGDYRDIVVISPNSLNTANILGDKLTYEFSPSSYMSVVKIQRFCKYIKCKYIGNSEVELITALNFGPLYDLINSEFRVEKRHLYEDGISSFLNLSIRYRYLKSAFLSVGARKLVSVGKEKFFSSADAASTIIYCDKPKLAVACGATAPVNDLVCGWGQVHNNEVSTYFLSSASIEYGLCSLDDYKKIIEDVARAYTDKSIVVSFHHNEKLIEEKLEIIKQNFIVSRVVEAGKAVEEDMKDRLGYIDVIAPFNSVVLSLLGAGRAKKLSLYDDGGPNMQARKEFIKKLAETSELEVDIYE